MGKIVVKLEDKGPLEIQWSNDEVFKKCQTWQRSEHISSDNFDEACNQFYTVLWRHLSNHRVYDDLPSNPSILDIGSGTGILSFLAYQYLNKKAKIYLLDKTEFSHPGKDGHFYKDEGYGFYHDWESTRDVIATSGFNPADFVLLNPNDQWDTEFDLVTSHASWCWHYPLDTYWANVKATLKIGGKLSLDVSKTALLKNPIVYKISNEFRSDPILVPHMNNGEEWGYKCIWIRKG